MPSSGRLLRADKKREELHGTPSKQRILGRSCTRSVYLLQTMSTIASKETEARLTATEDAAARSQARADEAYRKADEALAAAQKAQQTADEANERALRMLDKASRVDDRRVLVDHRRVAAFIEGRVRFEEHLAAADAELIGLAHDAHSSAHRHHVGHFKHVVVVHAEAAMAGAHADAELLVRAVDQVARQAEAEFERAQRVVRPCRHHVGQDVTVGGMFGLDRRGRRPGRVWGLGRHFGRGNRRAPTFAADAQREGVHHVSAFRVVVQTVLGEVDDDPFARARRQNEARRQHHLGACTRQPCIDAGVGGDHFQVAQIVAGGQVSKGVFVFGGHGLHLTNDVLTGRRQRKLQCGGGAGRAQRSERQTAGESWNARQHPEDPCAAARAAGCRTMSGRPSLPVRAGERPGAQGFPGTRTGRAVRQARSVDRHKGTRQDGAASGAPDRGRHISRKPPSGKGLQAFKSAVLRRSPCAQAGCAPTPERSVEARDPGAVCEPGMQGVVHLLKAKPQRSGIEALFVNIDELQPPWRRVRAQDLDLARAKGAVTVEIQRQRPLLFVVHRLHPV
nr:hypothetical protein [Tanacetum cinerariifolium]